MGISKKTVGVTIDPFVFNDEFETIIFNLLAQVDSGSLTDSEALEIAVQSFESKTPKIAYSKAFLEGLFNSSQTQSKAAKDGLIPCATKGYGNCAFHALLGEWNHTQDQFEANGTEKRAEFVTKVKMALSENSPLGQYYRRSIFTVLEGFFKRWDHAPKTLRENKDVKKLYEDFRKSSQDRLKKLNDVKAKTLSQVTKKIRDDQVLQHTLGIDSSDLDEIEKKLLEDGDTILTQVQSYFESGDSNPELSQAIPHYQQQLEFYSEAENKALNTLLLKKEVLDAYFLLLAQQTYYLHLEELEMAAKMHNKKVRLYVVDYAGGIGTPTFQKMLHPEGSQEVSIFHKGLHYERMAIEDKNVVTSPVAVDKESKEVSANTDMLPEEVEEWKYEDDKGKERFPYMGIHKLHLGFASKMTGVSSFEDVPAALMEYYEAKYKKKSKQDGEPIVYKHLPPNGEGLRQLLSQYPGFDLVQIFQGESQYERPMQHALQGYVEISRSSTQNEHYVVFIGSSTQRTLFALTTGQGYQSVTFFSSRQFPCAVMEKMTDPSKATRVKYRHILGNDRATEKDLKGGEVFQFTTALEKFVEIFHAPTRRDFPVIPRGTTIEMSLRQVLIRQKMSLLRLVQLVSFLSDVDSQKIILPASPEYRAFNRVRPVSYAMSSNLDQAAFQQLFSEHSAGRESSFDFCHRDIQKFLRAKMYRLEFNRDEIWRSKNYGRPVTVDRVLKALEEVLKERNVELVRDEAEFVRVLKQTDFRFTGSVVDPKQWKIINWVNGQVDYNEEPYFKVDGKWYKLSGNFIQLLNQDFRTMLKRSLITPRHSAALSAKQWQQHKRDPKDSNLGEKGVATLLNIAGKGQRAEYKKVMEILKSLGLIVETTGKSKTTAYKSTDAVKKDDIDLSKLDLKTDRKEALLKRLRNNYVATHSESERVDEEAIFNNGFIGKDYYLVGDKKTPDNIELFDIMKWDEKNVYFHHVKIGAAQSVRDVCSQAINAAHMIKELLRVANLEKAKNQLLMLWKEFKDSKETRTKKQIEEIEKEEDLFAFVKKRKVHFVVTLLEKRSERNPSRSLGKEKGLKDGQESLFRSNILKLDLVRAERKIKKWGLEFHIYSVMEADDEVLKKNIDN